MSDDYTRNEVERLMRLAREREVRPEEQDMDMDDDSRILVHLAPSDRNDHKAVDLEDFRWSYDWLMVPGPESIQ